MKNQKFGENFRDRLLTDYEQSDLAESKKFIQDYLNLERLDGLTFLDAGCGSGVFTLAALELGAKVTAFDMDPVAIQNTKELLKRFDYKPEGLTLLEGSILDEQFIYALGTFDVILCWGVVHHCGEMWKGIELITKTASIGSKIHFGIYNHADSWGFYPDGRFGPSTFWRKIKKFYVQLPNIIQSFVDGLATMGIVFIYLVTFNNPIKKLKSNERRGMNWQSDLKDWLIGYPYEYAMPEEVIDFMLERDFRLLKLKSNNGLLTNNYVFVKE